MNFKPVDLQPFKLEFIYLDSFWYGDLQIVKIGGLLCLNDNLIPPAIKGKKNQYS